MSEEAPGNGAHAQQGSSQISKEEQSDSDSALTDILHDQPPQDLASEHPSQREEFEKCIAEMENLSTSLSDSHRINAEARSRAWRSRSSMLEAAQSQARRLEQCVADRYRFGGRIRILLHSLEGEVSSTLRKLEHVQKASAVSIDASLLADGARWKAQVQELARAVQAAKAELQGLEQEELRTVEQLESAEFEKRKKIEEASKAVEFADRQIAKAKHSIAECDARSHGLAAEARKANTDKYDRRERAAAKLRSLKESLDERERQNIEEVRSTLDEAAQIRERLKKAEGDVVRSSEALERIFERRKQLASEGSARVLSADDATRFISAIAEKPLPSALIEEIVSLLGASFREDLGTFSGLSAASQELRGLERRFESEARVAGEQASRLRAKLARLLEEKAVLDATGARYREFSGLAPEVSSAVRLDAESERLLDRLGLTEKEAGERLAAVESEMQKVEEELVSRRCAYLAERRKIDEAAQKLDEHEIPRLTAELRSVELQTSSAEQTEVKLRGSAAKLQEMDRQIQEVEKQRAALLALLEDLSQSDWAGSGLSDSESVRAREEGFAARWEEFERSLRLLDGARPRRVAAASSFLSLLDTFYDLSDSLEGRQLALSSISQFMAAARAGPGSPSDAAPMGEATPLSNTLIQQISASLQARRADLEDEATYTTLSPDASASLRAIRRVLPLLDVWTPCREGASLLDEVAFIDTQMKKLRDLHAELVIEIQEGAAELARTSGDSQWERVSQNPQGVFNVFQEMRKARAEAEKQASKGAEGEPADSAVSDAQRSREQRATVKIKELDQWLTRARARRDEFFRSSQMSRSASIRSFGFGQDEDLEASDRSVSLARSRSVVFEQKLDAQLLDTRLQAARSQLERIARQREHLEEGWRGLEALLRGRVEKLGRERDTLRQLWPTAPQPPSHAPPEHGTPSVPPLEAPSDADIADSHNLEAYLVATSAAQQLLQNAPAHKAGAVDGPGAQLRVRDLLGAREEMKQKLMSVTRQLGELEQTIAMVEKDIEHEARRVAEATRGLEKTRALLSTVAPRLAALERDDIERQTDAETEKNLRARSELKEEEGRLSLVETGLKEVQDSQSVALEPLRAQIELARQAFERADAAVRAVEGELEVELETLRGERDEAATRAEEAVQTRERFLATIEELRGERDPAQQALEGLRAKKTETLTRLEALEKELRGGSQRLAAAQEAAKRALLSLILRHAAQFRKAKARSEKSTARILREVRRAFSTLDATNEEIVAIVSQREAQSSNFGVRTKSKISGDGLNLLKAERQQLERLEIELEDIRERKLLLQPPVQVRDSAPASMIFAEDISPEIAPLVLLRLFGLGAPFDPDDPEDAPDAAVAPADMSANAPETPRPYKKAQEKLAQSFWRVSRSPYRHCIEARAGIRSPAPRPSPSAAPVDISGAFPEVPPHAKRALDPEVPPTAAERRGLAVLLRGLKRGFWFVRKGAPADVFRFASGQRLPGFHARRLHLAADYTRLFFRAPHSSSYTFIRVEHVVGVVRTRTHRVLTPAARAAGEECHLLTLHLANAPSVTLMSTVHEAAEAFYWGLRNLSAFRNHLFRLRCLVPPEVLDEDARGGAE
eukprot:gnl/Chilomastix_cuspidata/3155.p1 GENE.gnl/Chilomastix_cuspidata/3155~~gnl/Chilomastix_cuspidata/3155.p1  ORF type:complete len:1599 (-),score=687.52 gnl/Chilomastix_cuspidata/3155:21-4817(-)